MLSYRNYSMSIKGCRFSGGGFLRFSSSVRNNLFLFASASKVHETDVKSLKNKKKKNNNVDTNIDKNNVETISKVLRTS